MLLRVVVYWCALRCVGVVCVALIGGEVCCGELVLFVCVGVVVHRSAMVCVWRERCVPTGRCVVGVQPRAQCVCERERELVCVCPRRRVVCVLTYVSVCVLVCVVACVLVCMWVCAERVEEDHSPPQEKSRGKQIIRGTHQ